MVQMLEPQKPLSLYLPAREAGEKPGPDPTGIAGSASRVVETGEQVVS